MKEFVTTVGNMKKLVKESSNEFKAKIGPGVEDADKKNNGKAYTDAKKRAKDFDGGLAKEVGEEHAKYEKPADGNKTMLDYTMDNASPEYKKRVHAQVKGYSSEAEMNNGMEKAGNFDDNEDIYNEFKKSGEKMQKAEEDFKASGLQASKLPKETFKHENMYESKDGYDMRQMINHLNNVQKVNSVNESIKTIYFKKTQFITENHMITKIPDDFKTNGLKFNMKDNAGNVYLVEWKNNKANVLSHINKNEIDSEFNRMKELMEYKTVDTKTSASERLNENDEEIKKQLDRIRQLM